MKPNPQQALQMLAGLMQNTIMPGLPGKFEQYQAILMQFGILTCAEKGERQVVELLRQIQQISALLREGEGLGFACSIDLSSLVDMNDVEQFAVSLLTEKLDRLNAALVTLQAALEEGSEPRQQALNEKIWNYLIDNTEQQRIQNNVLLFM